MDNHASGSLDGMRPGDSPSTPEDKSAWDFSDQAVQQPMEPTQNFGHVTNQASVVSSVYPSMEKEMTPEPSLSSPHSSVREEPISRGPNLSMDMPADDRPVPVVKVLSVRGVEYAMMSFLLWIGAGSLMFLLVSLIQGVSDFDSMAFPLALLLVCLPGFAFFYLRLRSAELANESLRLDASKRRFSQITQILAFLTCFFNIVTIVYLMIGMAGGNEVAEIGKTLGSAAVILFIAGGILYYYWVDEHKLVGRK
jgi:hypothetical protein